MGDPDWRICLTSVLCMPVRWADTASATRVDLEASKHSMRSYWAKLLGFGLLLPFAYETLGLSMIIVLIWAVHVRQSIRATYGLPTGDGTVVEDTFTWLFCTPCAIMQEALQAEFVDVTLRETRLRDGHAPQP